jgi:hypothetical protein
LELCKKGISEEEKLEILVGISGTLRLFSIATPHAEGRAVLWTHLSRNVLRFCINFATLVNTLALNNKGTMTIIIFHR